MSVWFLCLKHKSVPELHCCIIFILYHIKIKYIFFQSPRNPRNASIKQYLLGIIIISPTLHHWGPRKLIFLVQIQWVYCSNLIIIIIIMIIITLTSCTEVIIIINNIIIISCICSVQCAIVGKPTKPRKPRKPNNFSIFQVAQKFYFSQKEWGFLQMTIATWC